MINYGGGSLLVTRQANVNSYYQYTLSGNK